MIDFDLAFIAAWMTTAVVWWIWSLHRRIEKLEDKP